MNRTRRVWVVAIALVLAAAGVQWSARRPPAPPGDPPVTQPPPAGGPRAPAPGGVPDRPPDLYGVVERLLPDQPDGQQEFFVRSVQPPAGVPESSQNVWERGLPPPHVNGVCVADANVRRRSVGPARVAVGQTVSAWCSGEVAATYPAGWSADVVVIEADGG